MGRGSEKAIGRRIFSQSSCLSHRGEKDRRHCQCASQFSSGKELSLRCWFVLFLFYFIYNGTTRMFIHYYVRSLSLSLYNDVFYVVFTPFSWWLPRRQTREKENHVLLDFCEFSPFYQKGRWNWNTTTSMKEKLSS